MKIDIHAKNIDINPPLRAFVEEKLADLDHMVDSLGEASARVEVAIPSQHHHSGPIYYAEVNLTVPGHLFRAETNHHDLHSAIVTVKDELKTQLRRYKDKLQSEQRRAAEE